MESITDRYHLLEQLKTKTIESSIPLSLTGAGKAKKSSCRCAASFLVVQILLLSIGLVTLWFFCEYLRRRRHYIKALMWLTVILNFLIFPMQLSGVSLKVKWTLAC